MATELGRTGRRCDRVAKKKRKRRRPISRRRTALHQSKRDHGVPVVRLSPSLGTVLPFIFQLEWCVSSLCGSIARHFIVNGGKKKLLSDLTKKGNWKLRVAGNRRGSQSIDVFEIDWRGWPESVSFSRFCLRLFVCFFFVVLRPVKVGRPRRRNGRRLHGQAEPFSAAADGGEFRSWTPSASASSSKEEDRRWLSCSVDPRGRPPPQKKRTRRLFRRGSLRRDEWFTNQESQLGATLAIDVMQASRLRVQCDFSYYYLVFLWRFLGDTVRPLASIMRSGWNCWCTRLSW